MQAPITVDAVFVAQPADVVVRQAQVETDLDVSAAAVHQSADLVET